MEKKVSMTTLIGLLVALTIIAGLLLSLSNIAKQQRIVAISSYDECVSAGYPVLETYPSQCKTPDGRTFVNDKEVVTTSPEAPATNTPSGQMPVNNVGPGCAIGGCSGQICGEVGASDNMISTCEYRAEYACYKTARCEKQSSGKCGWTQTPQLAQCLKNPPALDANKPQVY